MPVTSSAARLAALPLPLGRAAPCADTVAPEGRGEGPCPRPTCGTARATIEGIAGFVEQGDVEIRASPEAPQEWALRGDQVSGLGILLAHGPFQLRLHERPGKWGDQPRDDVFEIRIAPDIGCAVARGIS